ncbi:MAG: PAS domain-containing sensor histidine kinase [Actinomycetota bacterium]
MRDTNTLLEGLIEASPPAIVALDRDGRVTVWNPAAERIFGWPADEVMGRPLPIVPHDRAEEGDALLAAGLEGKVFHGLETRRVRRDGTTIDVSASRAPIRDAEGRIVGIIAVYSDLTERKRVEAALRHSERRYRELFENALDLAFTTDMAGDITAVNRATERATGYTREELFRMSIVDLAAPEHRDAVRAVISLAHQVGDPEMARTLPWRYELDVLAKDGGRVSVEVGIRLIFDESGRPVGVQGIGRDLTQRRRAEAALRESEERHRELVENAGDIVFTHDPAGNFISVNRAVKRVLGYAPDELMGTSIVNLVAPGDRDRSRETILGAGEEHGSTPFELEVVAKDGTPVVLEVSSRVVLKDGKPVAVEGIARDISEWKRAAAVVQQSERYFRSLIENALDVIAVLDSDLRFLFASPSTERVLGYRPEQLVGRSVMDLLHEDDVQTVADLIDRGRRTPGFTPTVTIRIRHADGGWRVIEGIGENLLNDPAVEGIVVNARDVTDRTMAEQGLHRSLGVLRRSDQERRRLLGHLVSAQEDERSRIAAEIHDDSLQVMTAVGMRVETLARGLEDPAAREEMMRLQETVALSVQRLRKLLFDVRPPALDREGLTAALRLALNQLRMDTSIEWEVRSTLAAEPPGSLRTILYRIALEAINNIRKHARASRVDLELEERDGGVRMAIRDDGAGFLAERLEEDVPGSLGMMTMRERAQLAGGQIHIDTAPGKGTAIVAWIPLTPGGTSVAS